MHTRCLHLSICLSNRLHCTFCSWLVLYSELQHLLTERYVLLFPYDVRVMYIYFFVVYVYASCTCRHHVSSVRAQIYIGQSFSIFLAPTRVEVIEAGNANQYAACAWVPSIQAGGVVGSRCALEVNPYTNQHVLLRRTGIHGTMLDSKCTVAHAYASPLWIFAFVAAGLALFFAAPALSSNGLFRAAAVVFIFAAVAHVFVIIMLCKTATGPGAMWKFLAMTLTPVVGAYVLGSYWPLLARLDAQSIMLIYCVVFVVCGMIITMLNESALSNPNVGKMLRLFLWLTGSGLVFYATQSSVVFSGIGALAIVTAVIWQTEWLPTLRASLNDTIRSLLLLSPPSKRRQRGSTNSRDANTDILEGPKTPLLPTSPPVNDPRSAILSRSPVTNGDLAEPRLNMDVAAIVRATTTPATTTPRRAMKFQSPPSFMSPETLGPDEAAQLSPIVKEGKILNLKTQRKIMIHGSTYQKLVRNEGYSPDFVTGVLSPPPG